MKSVTLLAVLLAAAAVASADIHLVIEDAVGASRIAGVAVKAYLVKAVMDPGDDPADFAITSLDIRFDGPMLQSWEGTYDEDYGWSYRPTPYMDPWAVPSGKQPTIRDSRLIMYVTAPSPWAGELVMGSGAPAEDLVGGVVVPVSMSQHLYGKGTWLGALFTGEHNRVAYGITGGVTTIEIAQIIMTAADADTVGTHVWGDMGTKTQGGRHFDTMIGVPEPASLGLLAVGGVMALIRRRRA